MSGVEIMVPEPSHPKTLPAVQNAADLLERGQFIRPHPFKREEVTLWDEEGGYEAKTWNPGWRYEMSGPEDSAPVWDGEGHELRNVVSIHKPDRYPTRVFYTREWVDPDGKRFGKPKLRITTVTAFRRWANRDLVASLIAERAA